MKQIKYHNQSPGSITGGGGCQPGVPWCPLWLRKFPDPGASAWKVNLIGVIVFATVTMLIPWVDIFRDVNGFDYVDRLVYQSYFEHHYDTVQYKQPTGLIGKISSELLWHSSMRWLITERGISSDYVFGAISLFTLLTFGWLLASHAGVKALPLLLNPLVIDLAFSQLRFSLAISLLGAAWILARWAPFAALALALVTPFLHTAATVFLLIIAIVLLTQWASEQLKRKMAFDILSLAALILCGVVVSLAVGPFREAVLASFDDRRAMYDDISSSLAYSSFWVALAFPLALSWDRLRFFSCARFSVVIIAIVIVNIAHGGYSTRFLAGSFPLLLATITCMTGWARRATMAAFVVYSLVQWLYWFKFFGSL